MRQKKGVLGGGRHFKFSLGLIQAAGEDLKY
jgi:hypothetical protein